jgi:hypothetical protein
MKTLERSQYDDRVGDMIEMASDFYYCGEIQAVLLSETGEEFLDVAMLGGQRVAVTLQEAVNHSKFDRLA